MTRPVVRTVLVTGAGRGIGAACAEAFLEREANVIMISRSADELDATARRITRGDARRCLAVPGDVSDSVFVSGVFMTATERFGPIDVLVNNAAVLVARSVADISGDEWDQTMAVNVRGTFLCSQQMFRQADAAPGRPGVIINLSSLGGLLHTTKFPGLSAYVASKSAIAGLTEALAVEGRARDISVVCVAPGAVDTLMLQKAAPHLKAGATPADIAQLIVLLAESRSVGLLNGAVMALDTNR